MAGRRNRDHHRVHVEVVVDPKAVPDLRHPHRRRPQLHPQPRRQPFRHLIVPARHPPRLHVVEQLTDVAHGARRQQRHGMGVGDLDPARDQLARPRIHRHPLQQLRDRQTLAGTGLHGTDQRRQPRPQRGRTDADASAWVAPGEAHAHRRQLETEPAHQRRQHRVALRHELRAHLDDRTARQPLRPDPAAHPLLSLQHRDRDALPPKRRGRCQARESRPDHGHAGHAAVAAGCPHQSREGRDAFRICLLSVFHCCRCSERARLSCFSSWKRSSRSSLL